MIGHSEVISRSLRGLPFYADIVLFGSLGILAGVGLNVGAWRWVDRRSYVKWMVLGLACYGFGCFLAFLAGCGCA